MLPEAREHSFDELAKGLATGTLSRGKAIRWMDGALLGAALASFPGVAWANDCRRLGRECRRDSQCCSRNCVRRGDDKVCGCPEGKTRCNDRCVNLQKNENHCGECFNRCQTDQTCVGGVCCPDAQVCSTGTGLTCCAEGEECGVEGTCTPACLSNGATCTGNTDCCSGRCASGVCAEPCSSDRVVLSNGTCAEACGGVIGACAGCGGCEFAASGASYCRDPFGGLGPCQSDNDCPTGQFCADPSSSDTVCTGVW
jgi:hypothetical protein